MEEFLNKSRAALESGQNGQYLVVSGNEACDLDSTTCALAYAYFKQLQLGDAYTVVPLCNINRSDMPLRTEVVHWLRQCDLSWETLIYADDLFGPQSNFYKHNRVVSLILVDCHAIVGCLRGRNWPLKEVIDHHMLHPDSSTHNLDNCELKLIDAVGSCSSLVSAQILSNRPGELPLALWKLLYGAILLDTVGLSERGRRDGRLTDLDLLMASRIEDMIGEKLFSAGLSRETLFRGLENAKFDIKGNWLYGFQRKPL
ncbi:exopolyphosphatase [Paragonimus westermani]|uniref:Exopolyphosphatase n=1 Tax=Paragonimus westermani TaxID=34504 RepID=A0A5J4N433_9TREM|nr:exopolyphosphatase [Paragonimus westermani]